MIDLHCHLLPGMDDGPETVDEALELARLAVKEGIEIVYATPHHLRYPYRNDANAVKKAVAAFAESLRSANIPLEIRSGQEIRVGPELIRTAGEHTLLPLQGTHYVLLELPSTGIPETLDDCLHECRVNGWIPLIAHPERNRDIMRDPEKLRPWIEAGAVSQITAHSLTGGFGKETAAAAVELCRLRLAHVVSSDAHNVEKRPFVLREAYAVLERKLTPAGKREFQRNAAIVADGGLLKSDTTVVRQHRWFSHSVRS